MQPDRHQPRGRAAAASRAACAFLAFVLAACASQRSAAPSGEADEWLSPSPVLRQQIEEEIKRLPWTHGTEKVEQIRWFASIGEAAYSRLLELCLDPRPEVAGSAIAALGATGDSRLVEPMHALDWPDELALEVSFERARAFLRLGDWSEVDRLVAGLRSEVLWARAWCGQALYEATHERFGFEPRAHAEAREAAVKRWEEWLRARQGEGILTGARPKSCPGSR